jgi:hypothetical protein
MEPSMNNQTRFWFYPAVLCVLFGWSLVLATAMAARAEVHTDGTVVADQIILEPQTVTGEMLDTAPELTAERAAWLERATELVNRPRPEDPMDGIVSSYAPTTPPTEVAAAVEQPLAPEDFQIFKGHNLTDSETNNSVSEIAEPSVGSKDNVVFYTGNWFAAISGNGGNSFSYIDPDVFLPPIPGQFFCCDQSTIYDRSRDMLIWVTLYINSGVTTGTVRIAIRSFSNPTAVFLYDITSAMFGLAGLPDYPHIALGANSLYLTINHFNPFFTQTTLARLSLSEMKKGRTVSMQYVNRNEFNIKVAHDYGPGTTMYAATHVDSDTIRVFRWQEGSNTVFWNNIDIPPWTRGSRGQFLCLTPDINNPCDRMDDRVMGGFVTGPIQLPQGETAQKVVGFSWTARQGGSFPYPYTNVIRIDAENMTLIDNPIMFNQETAFIYADFHPNDRGHLAGVLDQVGGPNHPAFVATIVDEFSAPWTLHGIRFGNDSPDRDVWGDYNTVRRHWPNGYQWVAGGHTMQGGGSQANAECTYVRFGREQDDW